MYEKRASKAGSEPIHQDNESTTGDRATEGTRRPYRTPSVEKRRSLSQATLVTGGGTSGTLAGGSV